MVNLYDEMITRQKEIFTTTQQEKLKNTPVCIIGCGGLGGSVIEQLIRVGFENLTIVDEDVFDKTNMNRQLRSNIDTIDKPKSQITKTYIKKINPDANITSYNMKVDMGNVSDIISNSKIVIDAVDNIFTRVLISRFCYDNKLLFIHAAIDETTGQITSFNHNTPTYEELFNLKSKNMSINEACEYYNNINFRKPQVLGTIAAIFGCLEVNEVIKHVLKLDDRILAPNLLQWDVFSPLSLDIIEL